MILKVKRNRSHISTLRLGLDAPRTQLAFFEFRVTLIFEFRIPLMFVRVQFRVNASPPLVRSAALTVLFGD